MNEDELQKVLEGASIFVELFTKEGKSRGMFTFFPKYQRDSGRIQAIVVRSSKAARGEGAVLAAP